MNRNLILEQLRNDYIKHIDSDDKKNQYFKIGEISYLNIKKEGIEMFRNSSSGCGLGYADSILINADVLKTNLKRFISLIINIISFNKFFKHQKVLTKRIFDDRFKYLNYIFKNNSKVQRLVKKYKIENSTQFGCYNFFTYKTKKYSPYYLELCNKIDFINSKKNLKKIQSYCEIGGGFGANIHLMLQNFKNIKKVLLIDTFPTIYIATMYLRKFYKKSVISYDQIKNKKNIKFSNDKNLEIICIPPWKIDNVNITIDHFHNGDSFSHLEINKIKKYLSFLKKNQTKHFSVTDLDVSDKKYKVTSPKKYIKLFNKKTKLFKNNFIIDGLRKEKNIFFIGKLT